MNQDEAKQQADQDSVDDFVRIRSGILIVAGIDKLGKRKNGNENQGRKPGGYDSPALSKKDVNTARYPSDDYQVGNGQHNKAGTKNPKNNCIEILGQRTVKKIDVAVEDRALGQLPGRIKLLTEIDEAVVTAHHLQVQRQPFLELVEQRLDYFERKTSSSGESGESKTTARKIP